LGKTFCTNIKIINKMKILKKITPPPYSWLPLLSVFGFNMFVYYGTRLLNAGREHYMIETSLDRRIPLCTGFIVIYVLAYGQWACGYLLAARESRRVCRKMAAADLMAKAGTFAVFLIFPTSIVRSSIQGRSWCDLLTALIYRLDAPDNLFPSIHCLESWLCFRSSLWLKKVPPWYPAASFLFTVLVCASTVLVKQHVLVDIPAGILMAEIGAALSGRVFDIQDRFS